eukprot:NODE_3460_length_783_cov_301.697802.p1 GENE.NODE_3460_length_783_cov_301.697802~~NODE_3460_length_783_cov_301.697802.p1  ORF type:complete len:238 (+),score=37.53 NODE_3460_length_783_cov_301.697802:31-714(+)
MTDKPRSFFFFFFFFFAGVQNQYRLGVAPGKDFFEPRRTRPADPPGSRGMQHDRSRVMDDATKTVCTARRRRAGLPPRKSLAQVLLAGWYRRADQAEAHLRCRELDVRVITEWRRRRVLAPADLVVLITLEPALVGMGDLDGLYVRLVVATVTPHTVPGEAASAPPVLHVRALHISGDAELRHRRKATGGVTRPHNLLRGRQQAPDEHCLAVAAAVAGPRKSAQVFS